MRMFAAAAVLLLGVVSLAYVAAGAETTAASREYDERVLQDHEDDHYLDPVQDGHDLIALDVREEWNASGRENVLVFRLVVRGGHAATGSGDAELKDTVSFRVNDTEHAFTFQTSDNENFTGTFESVVGPLPVQDDEGRAEEDKFALEGRVGHGTLNVSVGDTLKDLKVEGEADDTPADTMPGSPLDPVGAETVIEEDFTVAGPTGYLSAEASESALGFAAFSDGTFDVTVTNLLEHHNQTVAFGGSAPDGVAGTFDVADEETRGAYFQIDGEEERNIRVMLSANKALNGTLVLEVLTSLGGRAVVEVDLVVDEPDLPDPPGVPRNDPSPTTDPSPHDEDDDHDHADEAEDTPGTGFMLTIAAGALVAAIRRRPA